MWNDGIRVRWVEEAQGGFEPVQVEEEDEQRGDQGHFDGDVDDGQERGPQAL